MSHLRRLLASVAGSLSGLIVGTLLFALISWRPWNRYVATWRQMLDSLTFQGVVIVALSFLGWLCFLLPLALLRKPGSSRMQMLRIVFLGALLGGAMVTVTYTLLFHGVPHAVRMSFPYEASGIINAATATAVCLWCLKRQKGSPFLP
jgi:hypothetical protein